MSDLQLLRAEYWPSGQPRLTAAQEAERNRRESAYWDRVCAEETDAYEASHAPTVLWTDARTRRQRARRRRERACRDAVAAAMGLGVSAFGLLGPSLLPLGVYCAGLGVVFVAAVVAVARSARKDNRHW